MPERHVIAKRADGTCATEKRYSPVVLPGNGSLLGQKLCEYFQLRMLT